MNSPWLRATLATAACLLLASNATAQGAPASNAPPPALPPPSPPPATDYNPPPPVVYTQPAPAAAPAPAPAPYQATVPEKQSKERTAFNTIFVELLGNGGLYSLNYDRLINDYVSIRGGFSYISVGASSGTSSASVTLMTFPVMANFLVGSPSHKLELGAGPLFAYASGSSSGGVGGAVSASGFGVAGTAVIGYRYVPYDGGFHFKVGFTPLFGAGGFLPWGGISFGYTF